MSNAQIKRGAKLQYAILDKNVEVEAGVTIQGTPENPVVITKNSHIVADIYFVFSPRDHTLTGE